MSESKPLTPRQEAKWTLAKIGDIKANPNNPRVIKDDKFRKLVESIRNFPKMMELRPIVVNSDMVVLGGNMRLKACKELGLKTVPIIMADDLTEDQQREFIIKDNVGFGEWDWAMLNSWDQMELAEWGLENPDFGMDEIAGASDGNQKDLSGQLSESFEVIITCESEAHQEGIYNKLIEEGFVCRVLTL